MCPSRIFNIKISHFILNAINGFLFFQENLKDLEKHKFIDHPNVWCSHFEFSGDQRNHYRYFFFLPPLPNILDANFGQPSLLSSRVKTRQQIIKNQPPKKICTKCAKICSSFPEFHKHILECGGDQTWMSGLFGSNVKKKCKWRPFRSRRRKKRQIGMKTSIKNSHSPKNDFFKDTLASRSLSSDCKIV